MNTLNSHTWAPEAFRDPARGRYGIIYSINNGRDGFFVNYTTDFQTVSAPQVFFDPGFGVLDGTVFSHGGINYLCYKNRYYKNRYYKNLHYRTCPTGCCTGRGPTRSTRAASRPTPAR
jgi:hypothetical protein